MPKRQKRKFTDLTWDDLEEWAGSKIVARGRDYQRHGHVSGLAITKDNGLIAWVSGSDEYATRVVMDDDGLPVSDCTCPNLHLNIPDQADGKDSLCSEH